MIQNKFHTYEFLVNTMTWKVKVDYKQPLTGIN